MKEKKQGEKSKENLYLFKVDLEKSCKYILFYYCYKENGIKNGSHWMVLDEDSKLWTGQCSPVCC